MMTAKPACNLMIYQGVNARQYCVSGLFLGQGAVGVQKRN